MVNIQNQRYQEAVSNLEDGKYEQACDKFAELGDYKDSASIAKQLKSEITSLDDAWEAYQDGRLRPLLDVIENHQLVKDAKEDLYWYLEQLEDGLGEERFDLLVKLAGEAINILEAAKSNEQRKMSISE